MHPAFRNEEERLQYVISYLQKVYDDLTRRKKVMDEQVDYSFRHYNAENVEQYHELTLTTELLSAATKKLGDMRRALKKPYFARVDFTPDGEEKQVYYIGKMAQLRNEDNTQLIIDWRAPVSVLYYEERLGRAAYDCPDGVIEGEISLKRQFIIEDAKLVDLFDIDIATNDEFLQIALGESKDNRLKDIVSTIQAEQNRIIRAPLASPLIVQGAAGSGKTTIALHRIAYLLYNYEHLLKPKNIMILAPNRFFLSYISEVLPELGVEMVTQTTFADFYRTITEDKPRIFDTAAKLNQMLLHKELAGTLAHVSRIKGSLHYKRFMDRYVRHIVKNLFPPEDFKILDYTIFPHRRIMKLLEDYAYLPIEKRLNEIRKYLKNALKSHRPAIIEQITAAYDVQVTAIKTQMADSDERRRMIIEIYDKRDAEIKQLNRRAESAVKDYFKTAKLKSAKDYYIDLFALDEVFETVCGKGFKPPERDALKKSADRTMFSKHKMLEQEDLAAILHLHYVLYGKTTEMELKHIIIDEAQDVSPFELCVLREFMGTDSFSILGDLYQGIYAHKGITHWNEMYSIFETSVNFMTLEQSYRTTVEIMDMANFAAAYMKLEDIVLAKPVIRHGSPVEIKQVVNTRKEIEQIVAEMKSRGRQSIAIITKTAVESKKLYDTLKIEGITQVSAQDEEYNGGIVVLPVHLAKGLEFDAVIISDASATQYTEEPLDIKLLYIAMTRPLHELAILHTGELTKALQSIRP